MTRRPRTRRPPRPRGGRRPPLAEPRAGILPDVTAAVGSTPLVALDRLAADVRPRIVAKLEHMNPGGSNKDRIAVPMIEAAERAGLLKPGGTIVEPTSGNTGVGLAQAAAVRGYRCVFVMADKQSEEKRALLRAYGAEIVVCPTDVEPDDERSYYRVSDRLAREIPGAWKPDQYHNVANPTAHYASTGPEIWEATEGRVTHLVVSLGTGGTVSGTGRYLKEQNPAIQVIGADPAGSVYSGDTPRPYLTEGIGEDFWPATYDTRICDVVVRVTDRDSMLTARVATEREGILMGESCGTVLWAALQVARDVDNPEAVFVVLLPDSGRNYVGKLYNDAWLREHGLLGADEEAVSYDWRATRPEVVLRGDQIPQPDVAR
jgi:cystathionine beta-synthase